MSTYFLVTATSLHRRLVNGISLPDKTAIVNAARKSEGSRFLGSLPRVILGLIKCVLNRDSVAVIPHPFHPVFALYCLTARNLVLYDDGTANYINSSIPSGRLATFYKMLSARHFAWRSVDGTPVASFRAMVESSKAKSFYAIFPSLQSYGAIHVEAINLELAFQSRDSLSTGEVLLLDTSPDHSPVGRDASKVFDYFKGLRTQLAEPIIYKPHPTGRTELGKLLIDSGLAMEITVDLEQYLESTRFKKVYSFYSSGAVVAKLLDRETQLFNLPNRSLEAVAPDSSNFFSRIGAVSVDL